MPDPDLVNRSAPRAAAARWLRMDVAGIVFHIDGVCAEEVALEDRSAEHAPLELCGPRAGEHLAAICVEGRVGQVGVAVDQACLQAPRQ